MLQQIETSNAPKALGPYSQAIKAGKFIFVSGQLGLDPLTNELNNDIVLQARQTLKNLKSVLESAGCEMSYVVRCDIFLAKITDFQAVNIEYEKFFTSNPKPARQTVAVSSLPKNAAIEISCIAFKDN